MNHTVQKSPRIEVIDALRGFAVVAIFIVHCQEHFIYPVYPTQSPAWLEVLDKGVFQVIMGLFAGKSYAIFALLFGFTFYIQSRNQERKGKDFGYRFLWRLMWLVGFASLNALFFPAGDVLLLFSITGISLFVVRKWSNKTVLLIAIFCLLQPIECYHFIRSLFDASYTLPNLGVGALYEQVGEVTRTGTLGEFFLTNVTVGQKASLFWAIGGGRFMQTIGLFMLGYLIARKELFLTTEKNLQFWIKALIIGAISFAPLYQLHSLIMESDNSIIQQTVGNAFDMWHKLAFTFVLIASFILLYQKESFKTATANLTFYGKMSLTNYVSQSFLGAIVFFPFGLHLAPYCGYTLSFLISLILVALQIQFCKWWLAHHKQGPLERLWHKLTWMGSKNKK